MEEGGNSIGYGFMRFHHITTYFLLISLPLNTKHILYSYTVQLFTNVCGTIVFHKHYRNKKKYDDNIIVGTSGLPLNIIIPMLWMEN